IFDDSYWYHPSGTATPPTFMGLTEGFKPLSYWLSCSAWVGATLVDPVDYRLNLGSGKKRHCRRVCIGGHLPERTRIVVEQRSYPLQRQDEIGVRAITDDEDRIGWIWSDVHSRDISGGKLSVLQRIPEIRMWCGYH